jgi:hypothetical protein
MTVFIDLIGFGIIIPLLPSSNLFSKLATAIFTFTIVWHVDSHY